MLNYEIEETAVWILQTNIEQSESHALNKLAQFDAEIDALKIKLRNFPEMGEQSIIKDIRQFPI